MPYWIISVPYEETRTKSFKNIKRDLEEQKLCECYEFRIPKLKTSNQDELFGLSDDLAKHDTAVESIVVKIQRQLLDLNAESKEGERDFVPHVILPGEELQSVPAELFLTFFQWDENQYLVSKPLTELVDAMIKKCTKYDDELKIKSSEYGQLKSNIQQIERKSTGQLTVRSLDGIVRKDQCLVSEYLQTIFVAVPNNLREHFHDTINDLPTDELGNHVGMAVAPDSAELITSDNEHALYSVAVLKKMVPDFKKACSYNKFTPREFEYNEERFQMSQMEKEDLESEKVRVHDDLKEWSRTAYSEVFSAWIHLKAIRTWVESILRYGLPPNICSLVIKFTKNETKIHRFFRDKYKHLVEEQPKDVDPELLVGNFATAPYGMEFHPYVMISVGSASLFKSQQ
jgi:V-type H+-transporting ATPase subunit C